MARPIGINHVALEVGDIDEALEWYGRFLDLELRGRIGSRMAFLDMGDQFIALRAELRRGGVEVAPSGSLDFLDPWGNHVQVVDYREIQFTKAPAILDGMNLGPIEKNDEALEELRRKGLGG